jgi:hypothetical protein
MDEQQCLNALSVNAPKVRQEAWEEQIRQGLLWRACCESVLAGDHTRLSAWHQALNEVRTSGAKSPNPQHVESAFAYLNCAELALAATLLPETSPPPVEALLPLLHIAADMITIPCDCDVDHGRLRTALEVHQDLVKTDAHPGRQDAQEPALAPSDAVDMVFETLASKPYGRPLPSITHAWAWDVTRTLLRATRRVVFRCEVTVAGTTRGEGVLPTLTLEVLEPGSGEVLHDPEDAFHTYADDDFLTSMQKAWGGALALAQKDARRVWDGRWSLRQGRERGSKPVEAANGCSASGAAALGWWHALMGTVPDAGVIVIAQVDDTGQDGIMRLKGVDDRWVFAKVQAIAQGPRFDTIVVASEEDEKAALQALGTTQHICVRNLADT